LPIDYKSGDFYIRAANMRRIIAIAAIVAAVWALLAFFSRRPDLNLLLISVDTLRADHLACYGHPDIQTPNIDRLANEGAMFTDAISTVPLTLPSHATILTGLYPPSHGIRDNAFAALPPDEQTLAEVLKQRGYSTFAVVGAFVMDSRYGLDQGFDRYDDDLSGGRKPMEFSYAEISADAVTEKALSWLKTAREPFFAFIHYYDPHTTYDPPEPFATTYAGSLYDGEIAYTDRAIGELMDFVRAEGLLERTLVVFLSDHGEGLGQHDEPAHGVLVYDSTLRVPLIVRAPEDSELRRVFSPGSKIDILVSLVDVYSSILDVLGIEPGHEVDGESFLEAVSGGKSRPVVRYFESLYPYLAFRWSPLRGVRMEDWKYILAPKEELYRISQDPDEMRNLASLEEEKARDLRNRLVKMFNDLEGQTPPSRTKADADEIRRLRALGYLSGSTRTIPTEIEVEGSDPKRMMGVFSKFMAAGEDAFGAGDMEKALANFTWLVEMDPGNPQVRVFRGRTYQAMGRLDKARADYLKAIEIDAANSTPHFNLGNIAQAAGDLDGALAHYRRALELVPGSPEALANIGSVLLEKGLADSARSVLRRAVKTDPQNRVATLNLGLAYNAMGQHDEALEVFHRTLELDPSSVKAMANIAAVYAARGSVDSTIKYLEAARRNDPSSATILANLGNAYRQKGIIGKAESCYERALDLDPANILALFGLAAVRAGQGNTVEAEALLKRLLAVEPDFAPARQALDRISSRR
jgi:arylsulfatase A-like enzyme/Flp pilus assembly protein TadD